MAFPNTILRQPAVGLAGQIADMQNAQVVSGVCQNANITPGNGVGWVSADSADGVRPSVVSLQQFRGIAILDTTREINGVANNPYVVGEAVSILTKGTIWISVAGAVTPADIVTVSTTGVIDKTPADGTHFQLLQARWETSTTGAGIARLSLNLM